jgi:hypothetical protein
MTCADVFSEGTSAALQVSALNQKKTSGNHTSGSGYRWYIRIFSECNISATYIYEKGRYRVAQYLVPTSSTHLIPPRRFVTFCDRFVTSLRPYLC